MLHSRRTRPSKLKAKVKDQTNCKLVDYTYTSKVLFSNACILVCHATDGPPNWVPPDHLWQIMLLYGWSPRTKYGCHRWSPLTIYGAVSGPPLPQMVPLKLSLEMMSHGSYEVNLANMDRVIIIIIYFSLCIASCSS